MAHAGLHRKVILAQTKHGTARRTYWVRDAEAKHETAEVSLRLNGGRPTAPKVAGVHPSEKVSIHYGLIFSKRANEGVDHAIKAIGQVHNVPSSITPVPIKVKGSLGGANGQYVVWSPFSSVNEIHVSKYTGAPAATAAHEYGHYLDHHLFGTGEARLSAMGTMQRGNKELQPLMHALYRSEAVKSLVKGHEEHTRNGNYRYAAAGEYLLMPPELFARAYAQWVGHHAGGEVHRGTREFGQQWAQHGFQAQWSDKDFAPIAREFDRLFENRGLRRRRKAR